MSQQLRRILVAFSLMAALALAAPSPSQAAGLWNPLINQDLRARFRAWIEVLLPGSASPRQVSHRTTARMEKEGSGINPDGAPQAAGSPIPFAATDEGSMIDPNGKK